MFIKVLSPLCLYDFFEMFSSILLFPTYAARRVTRVFTQFMKATKITQAVTLKKRINTIHEDHKCESCGKSFLNILEIL